jgi:hypothetical protein
METHKRKRCLENERVEEYEDNQILFELQEELMKCKIEQREIRKREEYTNHKITKILKLLEDIIENKEQKIIELEKNIEDLRTENDYLRSEEERRLRETRKEKKDEDSTFMYS